MYVSFVLFVDNIAVLNMYIQDVGLHTYLLEERSERSGRDITIKRQPCGRITFVTNVNYNYL